MRFHRKKKLWNQLSLISEFQEKKKKICATKISLKRKKQEVVLYVRFGD